MVIWEKNKELVFFFTNSRGVLGYYNEYEVLHGLEL